MRTLRAVALIATLLALVSLSFVSAANADPIKFARYPHSSGDHIAFSYHGDIWVADADGANARRLTAHVGAVSIGDPDVAVVAEGDLDRKSGV